MNDETGVKEDQSLGTSTNADNPDASTTWVYEIPFQYAWVAAKAVQTDLDPTQATTFMEREFPSVSRVRIELAAPDPKRKTAHVRAWQLHASCPFCDEGEGQLLTSDNWVDVFEWDEDLEGDMMRGGGPRGSHSGIRIMLDYGIEECLNWQFCSKAVRSWGLEACLEDNPGIPEEGSPETDSVDSGEPLANTANVYGISLAEVLASLAEDGLAAVDASEDASRDHEAMPIAREFGVEGYFTGLYRCVHCGNVFTVVYRDLYDDTRENRYRILPQITEVLDDLVARRGHLDAADEKSAETPGHAPTMSVKVTQDENRIALRANVAGRAHELIFDTTVGSILLNGETLVADSPTPYFRSNTLHFHPLIHGCLSAMPGLMLKLLKMLPSLPEGIDVSPAKLQEHEYGLNLLIAANRFVGYPARFYDAMTRGMSSTYPFEAGLPRDYSRIGELYEQTGLPEDEHLKRVVLERPQVMVDVLQKPDLPFTDVDVLSRFFQLPRIEFCMRMLFFCPRSGAGWRRLVEVKGEEPVFAYVAEQGERPDTLSSLPRDLQFNSVSNLLDDLCDRVTDEQLASVRMDRLYEDLVKLMEEA